MLYSKYINDNSLWSFLKMNYTPVQLGQVPEKMGYTSKKFIRNINAPQSIPPKDAKKLAKILKVPVAMLIKEHEVSRAKLRIDDLAEYGLKAELSLVELKKSA